MWRSHSTELIFWLSAEQKPQKTIFRNNLNIFRLKQIFAAVELYFNFLIIVKPIPFLPFFSLLNEFSSLAVCVQKCMWDIFKNCHITSSRIQWKGKGQQIMKYLLHTLDIYYRFVIGRYHYRWDPSCSWRNPQIFPKSAFHEWNSVVICIFTLLFDMQTTAVGLCHFGPPTHTDKVQTPPCWKRSNETCLLWNITQL